MVKQAAIVAVLIAGAAAYLLPAVWRRPASIQAGIWFEPVAFESARLGSPLTGAEIATIEAVARGELQQAFGGLPITISNRRDARYTLRVVQSVTDLRFK